MKYTPVLAITLLTLLEPITAAPIQRSSSPAYQSRSAMPLPAAVPHAVALELESRDITEEKRDLKYGFGAPTHFAVLPNPISRPATCGGVEGCTSSSRKMKLRNIREEEQGVNRAIVKRSPQDRNFIKDVEFSTE
jgi:hypothetical protein